MSGATHLRRTAFRQRRAIDVAPELVGRDQRNRSLALYFSRAVSRSDYVLAKLAALTLEGVNAALRKHVKPDAMLTEVHRQAQDDPIVRMSMDVREGRELEIGRHGESEVVPRSELDPDRVMGADQVLVGRNNTRRAYNMRVRQRQNIEDQFPVAGDKLVCLRNNRKKGLFNGGLWLVKERGAKRGGIITMRIHPDEGESGKPVKVSVRQECFSGGIDTFEWPQRKPYDEFDFGYVLTVHKSQGSQWDDVVLFDESFAFQDSRARWLYTGITRAAKRLSVVV